MRQNAFWCMCSSSVRVSELPRDLGDEADDFLQRVLISGKVRSAIGRASSVSAATVRPGTLAPSDMLFGYHNASCSHNATPERCGGMCSYCTMACTINSR